MLQRGKKSEHVPLILLHRREVQFRPFHLRLMSQPLVSVNVAFKHVTEWTMQTARLLNYPQSCPTKSQAVAGQEEQDED